MYVLRAFADSHPLNRLTTALEVTLRNEHTRQRFFQQFLSDVGRNPTVVTKPLFWDSLLKSIVELWHIERLGIKNPKNMRWDIPYRREVERQFELARLTYLDQFTRLEDLRCLHVYHEGNGIHPLKVYATRMRNLGFYDLDKKQYKRYLTPEEQMKRERDDWVPAIRPSPELEDSLLVAGRNHVLNRYGLLSALEEQGIVVSVVRDYRDIGVA